MQLKLVLIVLALCFAQRASAQQLPILFIVDASGSMKGSNQSDAEALLQGLSLPQDQLVSVTFFGAKPETANIDLCTEALTPPEPTLRGADFRPRLPPLGGENDKTAIGNALEAVLLSREGRGKFVLITDGIEECGADFVKIRNQYPDAEIVVRQVGKTPNPALQLLEISPRSPATSIGAQPAEVPPSAPLSAPTATCKTAGSNIFWAGLATSIFLIVVVLMLGSFAADEQRKVARWHKRQVDKGKLRKDDPLPDLDGLLQASLSAKVSTWFGIHWLTWLTFGLAALGLVVTLPPLWGPAPCNWASTQVEAVSFANSSFGSKFLPGLFVSFVGWILLQFWGYIAVRQTTENTEYQEHVRAEDRLRRIAEGAIRLEEIRSEFRSKWATMDRKERAREYLAQLMDSEEFETISAKIATLKTRILAAILSLHDDRILKRFFFLNDSDYRSLFQLMRESERIAERDEEGLREIFEYWIAYARGRTLDLSGVRLKLREFDPDKIRVEPIKKIRWNWFRSDKTEVDPD